MSLYETARNGFAIVGLLTVSGAIGLAFWHAVAAWRRHSVRRDLRANQRAQANARSDIPSDELDEIGYEAMGIVRREG